MAKTPISVKKSPDLKEITRIQKALIKKGRVKVGFPKNSGSYDDGTNVVDVAIWNEFGTENIPARSFMRTAIAEHKKEYRDLGIQMAKDIIKGKGSIREGLQMIGLVAASDIQNKITEIQEPALAESTIERKGSTKPLINTGKLRQSVTYEVDL